MHKTKFSIRVKLGIHVQFFFLVRSAGWMKQKQMCDAGISPAAILYSDNGESPHKNTQIRACSHWLHALIECWSSSRTIWQRPVLDRLLLNRHQYTQSENCPVPDELADFQFVYTMMYDLWSGIFTTCDANTIGIHIQTPVCSNIFE